MHGEGKYEWPENSKSYEGGWVEGKMQGKGTFKWADGRLYVGEYHQDKKHGSGVFTWPDGKKYDGEWKEGNQHGIGAFHVPSASEKGKIRKKNGVWENGKHIEWTTA